LPLDDAAWQRHDMGMPMSRRYPTVKQQEAALDEMKRILGRDIDVMTGDEIIEPTPELLERVVLFEGILQMFNILEEKIVAGVLLASKIIHEDESAEYVVQPHIKDQAAICLELMIGKEE